MRFHRVLTGYLDDRTVDRIERIVQADRRAGHRHRLPRLARRGVARPPRHAQGHARRRRQRARPGHRAAARPSPLATTTRCWATTGSGSSRAAATRSGSRGAPASSTSTARSRSGPSATRPSTRTPASTRSSARAFPARTARWRCSRSPRGTWRRAPRARARCSSRAATTASSSLGATSSSCGRTSPTSTRSCDSLGDEARRQRIVEAAHRDVVASGRYTYRAMVEDVERVALGDAAPVAGAPGRATGSRWS